MVYAFIYIEGKKKKEEKERKKALAIFTGEVEMDKEHQMSLCFICCAVSTPSSVPFVMLCIALYGIVCCNALLSLYHANERQIL